MLNKQSCCIWFICNITKTRNWVKELLKRPPIQWDISLGFYFN